MNEEQNGAVSEEKVLQVLWNPATQQIGLNFNSDDFKTWDFVMAILDMARERAKETKVQNQLAAMQSQAMAAQQDAVLRRQIRKL